MNMCPVDQFCFDKNTFILLIVGIILFVAHHIGNTNEKIDKLERNIENNDSRMTHKIKKYRQQLGHLKEMNNTLAVANIAQRNQNN